jgi:hypothetical protein
MCRPKSSQLYLHFRLCNKNFVRISYSRLRATPPPNSILRDSTILIILGEGYKMCSVTLCSFLLDTELRKFTFCCLEGVSFEIFS